MGTAPVVALFAHLQLSSLSFLCHSLDSFNQALYHAVLQVEAVKIEILATRLVVCELCGLVRRCINLIASSVHHCKLVACFHQ